MNQQTLDLFRALSAWFDNENHRSDCMFGHVVQDGPAAGNKIPCTCGLLNLQSALERATTL